MIEDVFRIVELTVKSSRQGSDSKKSIKTLAIGGSEAGDVDRKISSEKFEINIDHENGLISVSLRDDIDNPDLDIRTNFEISLDSDKFKVALSTIIVTGVKDSSTIECLSILKSSEIQEIKNAIELLFSNVAIKSLTIEEGCIIKSLSLTDTSTSNLKVLPHTQIQNLLVKDDDCFETLEIGDNAAINSISIENCRQLRKITIGKNCVIGTLKISKCGSEQGEIIFLENAAIHDISIEESNIAEVIFQSGCKIGMMIGSSSTKIDEATKLSFETGCQVYHQGYKDPVRMIYPTTTHAQKDAEYAIKAKFGEGVDFEIICPRPEISVAHNKRIRDNCVVM